MAMEGDTVMVVETVGSPLLMEVMPVVTWSNGGCCCLLSFAQKSKKKKVSADKEIKNLLWSKRRQHR